MSIINLSTILSRESVSRYVLLLILSLFVSLFFTTVIIAQNTSEQDFDIMQEAECGSNTQYIQVAGGGFEANGAPVCIDLAAFGINPADIAGNIPITLYYDLGFSSVVFYTSNNPGTLIQGVTSPTSGPGGIIGDHFATAMLPNDGSTMICAIAVFSNNGNAEDGGLFATIPITNPAFCNGSIFGTALDNELVASGGVAECATGTFPIAPNGDVSQLIDIDLQFTVAEVIPGDPRPIEVMFEACGAVFSQSLDPEPPAGETGFAILNFTLADVPADCDELIWTFCSPPGGQSFGIGGFSAEVTCAPTCIASNNSPICAGGGTNLMIFSENSCGASYSWTGPNGFTSTDQNPIIPNPSVDATGTYTLTVIGPDGTETTCSTDVEILEVPAAVGTLTNPTCDGDAGSISFTWVDTGAPRGQIEFSITGAGGPYVSATYADEIFTDAFTGLASGPYDLFVRWGNEECPVDLADLILVEPDCGCDEVRTDAISEGSAQPCLPPGQTIERNIVTDDLEVLPPGFQILYILVDQNGTIVTTNPLSFYNVNTTGSFTAYSVAYNPAIYDVATATTFNDIIVNLDCGDISAGLPIVVEECCQAFAGNITQAVVDGCASSNSASTLTWTLTSQNIPPGYVIEYVLTDGATGLVLQTSATPSFNVNASDFYKVHSVVFLPSEFSLAGLANGTNTIFSINGGITSEGLCADVNIIGGNFVVSECCPSDLYIPGPGVSVPAGFYERDVSISSDGIVDNGTTDFDAGFEIELLPGFEVGIGIEFHAFIDGCN